MKHKKDSNFSLSRLQIFFSIVLVIALVVLSVLTLGSAKNSLKFSVESQTATSQLEAATEVRRQIFDFDVSFSQWTTGHIPLSELMNVREPLLQSLGVSLVAPISYAKLGNQKLAVLLQAADQLMSTVGPGYFPIKLQDKYLVDSLDIINGLTSVARTFTNPYVAAVDSQINNYSKSERATSNRILSRFLIWLVLAVALILWIVTSFRLQTTRSRKEMMQSQQSLELAREELNEAHETVIALQKINETKSDFVSTLNHEMRTPLTSIIGYLDILKDFTAVSNDKEFHKYLGVMDRNAFILNEIIESILFLSSLDNQEIIPDPTVIDLVDLCESVIFDQSLLIKEADVKVKTKYIDGQYYTVLGSKALLAQVFSNLISNAVKFSPAESTIEISFTRYMNQDDKKLIRVEVKDQGIGIPPAELPNLFTKFYRASNAVNNEVPGSGLGLAIVKRIVDLHQGEVSADSVEGEGATMIVELPFAISSLEELVMGKRQEVLERAIKDISEGPVEDLVKITHDVGGAIGFYTYIKESEKLISLSQWLKKNPHADKKIIAEKKSVVLDMLHKSLVEVKKANGS